MSFEAAHLLGHRIRAEGAAFTLECLHCRVTCRGQGFLEGLRKSGSELSFPRRR